MRKIINNEWFIVVISFIIALILRSILCNYFVLPFITFFPAIAIASLFCSWKKSSFLFFSLCCLSFYLGDAAIALISFIFSGLVVLLCGHIANHATNAQRKSNVFHRNILDAVIRLSNRYNQSMDEIMDAAVAKVAALTQSEIGYISFVNPDETIVTVRRWSKPALEQCKMNNPDLYFDFDIKTTGMLGEPLRQRKPFIVNNYKKSSYKKGLPEGHVPLNRYIGVPIFYEGKIVCIGGAANKVAPYDEDDVRHLTILLTEMWQLIRRKQEKEELDKLIQETTKDLSDSENKFRVLFEDSPDAYLIMDTQRAVILDCNKSAEILLGGNKSDIVGKDVVVFSPEFQPDGRPTTEAAVEKIQECYDRGGNRFEWMHKKLNGDNFWCHVTVSLANIYDKEVFLVGWRDISHIKKYQSDLKKSNNELTEFAYVASHDLKAPLRAVSNLSNWIAQDAKKGLDVSKYVDLMKNRITRMDLLIEGLLEYSRIGRTEKETEILDMNKIPCSLCTCREDYGDRLVFDSLPLIKANKIRMHQVFHNLVYNAFKHHPDPANAKVHVSCEETPNEYVFCVADNGAGIDPKYHKKIFDLFQTINTKDSVESTGIGLTLVKKIVEEEFKGKIWLASKLGVGSKFYFTFSKYNN